MINIDFETLTDEQLDKLLKIANIAKINAEIDAMNNDTQIKMVDVCAKLENMEISNAKLQAERIKAEKEAKLYPWVAVGLGLIPVALAILAVFK